MGRNPTEAKEATAAQMEMARRIASAHYRKRARDPRNSYGHEMAHADRIDAGLSDDWDCVQTALAAIAETSDPCGPRENKAGGLWYRRWFNAQARVNELEAMLENPPKHKFWGASEAECPREIKAPNGELHTLRCKVCGLDNPRDDFCRAHLKGQSHDAH